MTDRYAHIVLPHADEPLHPERAEWVHNYILAGCCAGLGKYEWDTIKAALKRLCPGEKTVSIERQPCKCTSEERCTGVPLPAGFYCRRRQSEAESFDDAEDEAWEQYEEGGPMDLEDQLERLLK